MDRVKIFRISTVPIFLNIIYKGQLKYLNQFFEVHGVTSMDNKHFAECADREGIRMHEVPMSRKIAPWDDLKSLWRLYRIMRKERPAIVHTHTPKAGLVGMMAAFIARVPCRIHTYEGLPMVETRGVKRIIFRFTETLTCFCATKILSNSNGLMKLVTGLNLCSSSKIEVLGAGSSNGIDTEFFNRSFTNDQINFRLQIRTGLSITETDIVFCFVGRLGVEKGIRELVDAFLKIRKSANGVKLLLVGPWEEFTGVLDETYSNLIKQSDGVIYVGRHDDIRPYLLASDVFVFPSYREGFPNAVLQAGAMELPLIVTNINGCNEIVEDNKNGLLVEPKSVTSLSEAMEELLLDSDKRNRLKTSVRSSISNKYDQQKNWALLHTEYKAQLTATGIYELV